MAAPTNTLVSTTLSGISNREDLSDTIYRISPTQTPLLNMAAKGKATNTLHEWQTQDLAVNANNAQAEGDTLVAKVVTVPVRLTNKTQISAKAVFVSGTQLKVNSAGFKDAMSYELSLAGLEIKRDIETGLTQNNVTASAPRQSRGLVGWAGDNVDSGAGYVAPVYSATNTAQTDGTQAAFTEARLKNVLQKVFVAGGEPNVVMMGAAQKQTFSTFTGM